MTYLVVVNNQKANDDTIIPVNASLALLPPYSGG